MQAQSTANYTFTSGSAGSLASDRNGNAIDLSTGAATLVAASTDDGASTIASLPFDFFMMGKRYSTYSASSNGLMELGATPSTTLYALPNSTNAEIAPFANDLMLGTNGLIRSKVFGTAPNRTFVIEWNNEMIRYNLGATGLGTATFQVRLYEGSGIIEFIYGTMTTNAASPTVYYVGFSTNTTANNVLSVNTGANPATATTSATVVSNSYTANSTITALNSAADGSRVVYTFLPPGNTGNTVASSISAPTSLTTSNVTQTGYTLNWTAPSTTTGILGYAIYSSTDNVTFNYLATVSGANTTSYTVTGQAPSTTAYYKVAAYSEGALSTFTNNLTATTSAPGNITAIASGLWSATSTWSTGVLPTQYDTVNIPAGTTVTIDGTGTADIAYAINIAGTLQYDGTTTAKTLTITKNVNILSGGIFQTNTTSPASSTIHTLTLGGDFVSAGTLNFVASANSKGNIIFTGAQNNIFNLSANTATNLYTVTENKTANTNILDFIPGPSFTVSGANTAGFLTITAGTFKLDGTTAFSNPLFATAAYSYTSAGGFWLNNPNAVVVAQNASTGTIAGPFKVTQGTFNVGTAANQNLNTAGASVTDSVQGGTINVAGYWSIITNATYTMSGGTVNVATLGNTSTTASFNTGSAIITNISGGTINIVTAGTTLDYSVASTYPTNVAITGGTLTFGSTSGASFHATGVLPITVQFGPAFTKLTMSGALYAYGILTLPAGDTLSTGANTLTVLKNLVNNGVLIGGVASSGLSFNGSTAQSLSGTGSIPSYIASITINNTSGASPAVTISQTDTVLTALTLTTGSLLPTALVMNGRTGTLTTTVTNGTMAGSPIFPSTFASGTYNVTYNASAAAYITGGEIAYDSVNTLVINNGNGITLSYPLNIKNTLTLTSGLINTSATNLLTIGATATAPAGSATSYINGPLGINLNTAVNTNKIFAIGKAGAYRPVSITNFESNGTFQTYTAEVLSGASGGTGSGGITLDAVRYYSISNTANIYSTTTAGVALPIGADDGITAISAVVAQANTANGTYTSIGSKSNTAAGTFDTSSTTLIQGNNYFSLASGSTCTAPAQPGALTLTPTATTVTTAFTSGATSIGNYIVVASTAALTQLPVNGTLYTSGTALGNGTVIAVGGAVAASTAAFIASTSALISNTSYIIYVFPYNNAACTGGPVYNTTGAQSGTTVTCPAAAGTPVASNISSGSLTLTWTASATGGGVSAISYIVDVATTSAALGTGDISGFPVTTSNTTINLNGLALSTAYYYRITAVGACNTIGSVGNTTTAAGNYVTMPVSAGFNNDVVAEGTANPNTTVSNPVNPNLATAHYFGNGYAFTSANYSYSGYSAYTNALPTSGFFSSYTTTGLNFQLGNYTGNNALTLWGYSANSGTITFATPIYASTLYLLGTATDAGTAATTSITITFTDGSTQTGATWAVPDWFGSATNVARYGLGRVSESTYIIDGTNNTGTTGTPRLYYNAVAINTANLTKQIQSVTLSNPGSTSVSTALEDAFFGASAKVGYLFPSNTSMSFTNTSGCAVSAAQSFTVNANSLSPAAGNISVTAPAGFLVSSDGTTYGSTATIAYTGSAVTAAPVYVEFSPAAAGITSGNITFSGGTLNNPQPVSVTGTGSGIYAAPAVVAFGNITSGTTSSSLVDTVKGINVTTGSTITVTSPNAAFTVSADNTTFGSSASFTTAATTVNKPIYIRYAPTVNGADSSIITIAGGGGTCATPSFKATGTGTNGCVAPATLPTALTFAGTTASGTNISFTANGTPDGYLVLQSTVPFSGTPANGTAYTIGNTIGNAKVQAIISNYPAVTSSAALTNQAGAPITGNTAYYVTVVPYNGGSGGSCGGGPLYAATGLTGNYTTCPAAPVIVSNTPLINADTLRWSSSSGGAAGTVSYTLDISTSSSFTTDITGYPATIADNAGGTIVRAITGLTSGTTYYYRIIANGSVCNSTATTGTFAAASYCTSTFTNGCSVNSGYYISSLTYSNVSISQTTGNCSTHDYTAQTATVPAGSPVTMSVTTGSYTGCAVWVDFNNNGVFSDPGETLFTNYNASGTYTYTPSITIPASVPPGVYRMRVMVPYGSDGTPGACTTYAYGTYADFNIQVTNPSFTVSGTPIPDFGSIGSCDSSSNPNNNIQGIFISGSSLYPATGSITVNAPAGFQVSADAGTWGSTAAFPYTGGALSNVTVYLQFVPTVSGNYSGNITFTGGGIYNPPVLPVTGIGSGLLLTNNSTYAFGNITQSTTSAVQVDTVKGYGLTAGNITVTSSNSDFAISPDNTNWYATYQIATGTSLAATPVYVRFTPTAVSGTAETSTISFTGAPGCVTQILTTGTSVSNCTTPSSPTAMQFSGTSTTENITFTAPTSAPNGYLLVRSTAAFTGSAVNNTEYSIGATLGNGTIIQKNLSSVAQPYAATGLTANTQYYFTLIPYNGGTTGSCGGGPLYGTPLSASVTTCAATPGTPVASNTGSGSFTLSWAASAGGSASTISYIVDVSTTNAFTSDIAGFPVVTSGLSTVVNGLSPTTTYYYRVTAVGSCNSAPTTTASTSTLSATYVTMPIATGLNNDVVADSSLDPTASVSNPLTNPAGTSTYYFAGGYGFVAGNYTFNSTYASTIATLGALPISRVINSAQTSGLTYQLAPYSGNNALTLFTSSGYANSGTLTYTTPIYASTVYVLATASNASTYNAVVTPTITFTDGSSQVGSSFSIIDWFTGTSAAFAGGGRVNAGAANGTDGASSGSISATGATYLYQYPISISASNYGKKIASITFTPTAQTLAGTSQEVALFASSAQVGYLSASASSLSAFANTCSPSQTFTIGGSSLYPSGGSITGNAPTGFQISADGSTWGSTASFAYTGTTLSSATVYVRPSPSATGAVSGNVTFTGGTVNNPPVVAVSSAGTGIAVTPGAINFGNVTVNTNSAGVRDTLTGSGLTAGTLTISTSNSDFQLSTDNTAWSSTSINVTNTGSTLAATPIFIRFSPTATTAETSTITITGSGTGCTPSFIVSGTGIPCVAGTWLGTTSNDYGTASNWSCGTIPTASNAIIIPAGVVNMPTISSGTYSAASLKLMSTDTLTLSTGAVLNVSGAIIDSGAERGAGTIILNGSAAQSISGNGRISNLTLSNNTGATITSGSALNLANTLTLTSGTLTTNGGLTLLSDATRTARIATIPAGSTISGNVKVQQYIPGGRRAFRFFGHPFSAAIALSQLEANIDITGNAGAANGFTPTGSNNPSAFWYNPITGNGSTVNDNTGWIPFTSTNGSGSNAWSPYEGIRVLVRGSQGQGLDGNAYTPSAATLNMTGAVNQGAITETMHKGANSGFNLLSNPYPSPVDIGTVIGNANTAGNISGAGYWVWDANQQTAGAYVVQTVGSGAYSIPGNTSFVVNASADGTPLTFAETNKTATSASALLKANNANDYVLLSLYDGDGNPWDRTYFNFNSAASATLENMDARKLSNTALDFYSYSTDSQRLSIDARPYVNGEVIPLGIVSTVSQQFTIKVESYAIPAGGQLFLHDKYLGVYQPLSDGAEYSFAITNDAASQGDNRFELGMGGTATAVSTVANDGLNMNMVPNPAKEQVVVNYNAGKAQATIINVISITGQKVMSKDLGITEKGSITLPLQQLPAGMYMVELTSGNQIITKKLIKQ